jgi:hypothetical protein
MFVFHAILYTGSSYCARIVTGMLSMNVVGWSIVYDRLGSMMYSSTSFLQAWFIILLSWLLSTEERVTCFNVLDVEAASIIIFPI